MFLEFDFVQFTYSPFFSNYHFCADYDNPMMRSNQNNANSRKQK